ncbi:MAG: helix-turn-helix domain-containing protein [Roseomonas sp.]|nr:helix-turn-helix domain-containing protein [Roseomonas sp.]
MIENAKLRRDQAKSDTAVGVDGPKSDVGKSHERLREAVRLGGGPKAISGKAGIPTTTLQGYLTGGEMKLSNAIALAEACGVRLEWLATGAGPMREGGAAAPPPPRVESLPAGPVLLFGKVRIDRLVRAYEGALATTGGQDKRLTMHLTIVLHDQLAEAEEPQKSAG